MAGHLSWRRVVAPGGTGGAVYASDVGGSEALVSNTPSTSSATAYHDVASITVDVDSYVAFGTAPDASVTTARDLIRAGERYEARCPIGTKVEILDA